MPPTALGGKLLMITYNLFKTQQRGGREFIYPAKTDPQKNKSQTILFFSIKIPQVNGNIFQASK